ASPSVVPRATTRCFRNTKRKGRAPLGGHALCRDRPLLAVYLVMSIVAEVPLSTLLVLMAWVVTRLRPSSDRVPPMLAALKTLRPRLINVNAGALVIPKVCEDTELFSTFVNFSCVATRVRITVPTARPNDYITTGIVAFTVVVVAPLEKALADRAALNDPNSST